MATLALHHVIIHSLPSIPSSHVQTLTFNSFNIPLPTLPSSIAVLQFKKTSINLWITSLLLSNNYTSSNLLSSLLAMLFEYGSSLNHPLDHHSLPPSLPLFLFGSYSSRCLQPTSPPPPSIGGHPHLQTRTLTMTVLVSSLPLIT